MITLTPRWLETLAILSLALTPHLHAQTTASPASANAAPVSFDVVSIRPSDPNARGMSIGWSEGAFRATNMNAMNLLSNAYGIRADLITGAPNWVHSDGFDVTAKIDTADAGRFEKLKDHEREAMLKSMLADRFRLKAHTEVKQLPVYELVIAKGGSKVVDEKEHTEPDPDHPAPQGTVFSGWVTMSGTSFHGKGIALDSLISSLEGTLERTIIDKTGLTGDKYDIKLTWTPDNTPRPDDAAPPPLFTALQDQLGLRLVPSKGPVDTLVIDHIEKPSEN